MLWAVAACGALPRDAESTSDTIARRHIVRVGASPLQAPDSQFVGLLDGLQRTTGARSTIVVGDVEPLLTQLEEGKLDLVVGWFDEETPWADRVSLAPALRSITRHGHALQLRAALRNGENSWIMTVEEASRRVGARPS